MGGHENYAAASAESLLVVFQSILHYQLGNVCLVQFRKVTEFHQQAPEIPEGSTEDLHALFVRKVRKSHLKVAETCRTLPPGQAVRLHVWRDRKTVTLEGTVGDWAKAQSKFAP